MTESQEQAAFARWLDSEGIYYVRSRMDKKTTTRKGILDFSPIALAGRCLFLEMKRLGGKLREDQEKEIDRIRKAGNRAVVAFSAVEAIEIVKEWAGILPDSDNGQSVVNGTILLYGDDKG